jgi:WD40 repeat protein
VRVKETAQVWDLERGQPAAEPLRHLVFVRHAAFSPDGTRVVTASDDGTARVWDTDSGVPVGSPLEHKGRVFHAAFSRDGRRVVTSSEDGTARIWDAATGEPLCAERTMHRGWAYHAAFSPDGLRLATGGNLPGAAVWDVRGDERPVEDLLLLAEVLSAQRFGEKGPVPLTPDAFRRDWERLAARYPQDLPSTFPEPGAGR